VTPFCRQVRLVPIRPFAVRLMPSFQTAVLGVPESKSSGGRTPPPEERAGGVLGMFSSSEVKILQLARGESVGQPQPFGRHFAENAARFLIGRAPDKL
jgi:hypothetical protein